MPATACSPAAVMPTAPVPPEKSGPSAELSEKCWCAPDPTLPAKGAGDRLTRSPCRRATRLMMSRVNASWSAAATGASGDSEISNWLAAYSG
ncbi:Uncharacterised protein [Mycobacterium tuberculosis]|nr:Uncharacterised protein [Mycobacterium tuberculosis]